MDKKTKCNILLAGTPGTGKSTVGKKVLEKLGKKFIYVNIGEFAKKHNLFCGYDQKLNSYIIDDEKVKNQLEKLILESNENIIIEFHGGDKEIFDPKWLKAIFVFSTKLDILDKRLSERSYSDLKIKNNLESEIFEIIYHDILEEFRDEKNIDIFKYKNNDIKDLDSNVKKIVDYVMLNI